MIIMDLIDTVQKVLKKKNVDQIFGTFILARAPIDEYD